MKRITAVLVLTTATMIAAACSTTTSPGGPVAGRWHTDSALSRGAIILDMTLTQTDTVIEGDGMYGGTRPRQADVIGFYSSTPIADPIILTVAAVNTVPALLRAHLSTNGDTLVGTYQFLPGTVIDTVAFARQ